jgi:hypothetical protein
MSQSISEKIDLLGNVNLRCLSVIKVEGSRSYNKAIAFIRKNDSLKNTGLKAKNYFNLYIPLEDRIFLEKTIRKTRREYLNEKLA